MRKIIIATYLTMDGVLQAPGGPEKILRMDSNGAAGPFTTGMI